MPLSFLPQEPKEKEFHPQPADLEYFVRNPVTQKFLNRLHLMLKGEERRLADNGGENELDKRRGRISAFRETCGLLDTIATEIADGDNPDEEIDDGNTE
jgi:hypothetical protein